MKYYLFLFVFWGYCIIFGQAISREDSAKIDKEIESKKWLEEISRYRKEQCSKDSLKAVDDSKTINKYFIGIAAPYGSDFPADKELEASLKKLGIIWGGTWMGNCLTTYSSNSCYYRYMNEFTEEKFGKDVIDNIVKQALLQHIESNPAILFEYNDHLDWLYEDNHTSADSIISDLFFKNFKYPKGYKYSSQKKSSFTEVNVSVVESSYILKDDSFKHHIDNNHNKKFIAYFEKEIRKFIKSRKFALSKYSVNHNGMKTHFTIYFK